MEETTIFSEALNFLSLGLSVVLLFAVAYLWSSNSRKSAQLQQVQSDLQKVKKKLSALETKVNEIREPTVVSDVPQAEPFGLNLDDDFDEPRREELKVSTPLAPQNPWLNFVKEYNDFAEALSSPGQLKKCEKFVRDNKLKILTYGSSMTFRPAIDVKDSIYWAFKGNGGEFAVVPNPMNPCDAELYEFSGMKDIYAMNYQDGIYRKYFVKLPAILISDPVNGWMLKDTGVVNLER